KVTATPLSRRRCATRFASASVRCFSRAPSGPWAPRFDPPWPGSRTTTGALGAAAAVPARATSATSALQSLTKKIFACPRARPQVFRQTDRCRPLSLTEVVHNATVFRLSVRRLAGGISPVHILLLVAFLEVAINRVAVPLLRPSKGTPPTWHTALDYAGLFLF